MEVFEHENNSAIYKKQSSASAGAEYLEARFDEIDHHFNKDTSATLQETAPKAAPKEQVSSEQEAEDIATAVDNKQKINTKKPTTVNTGQRKTEGKWVDPKYKGRTKNTWLF